MKKIVGRIISIIFILILAVLMYYICLPAINIQNYAFWIFLIIISIIFTIMQVIIDSIYKQEFITSKIGLAAIGIFIGILIIGAITAMPIFNVSKYRNMVEIEAGNFNDDINKIEDSHNISIVDMETAKSVGDRTLGAIKNSTWYEVDEEYNLITYNNKQYRISPINYGNLFKYQKAKNEGIPGYVLIDTLTQEAKYVELDETIKYSPSAYFSKNLKRHLRFQYPNYIFGKSFFEIDENGKPYYITSIKKSTIGMFGGLKEESFIVTNACNGESKEYKIEELPEWIEHAYDLEYLMHIAEYNLKYINGYWNSVFSKTGIVETSYNYVNEEDTSFAGYNTTITSDKDIVFYVGLTPANASESNVGFLLANPRTGKIKRYECAGAEESSAMKSAESLVQDLKYTATFPTILNVDGNETYFMLLKDKSGLVQRYSLCNVKNYTKVVQSDSLDESLKLYREKLGLTNSDENGEKISGTIEKIYQAQIDGTTYYYYIFKENNNIYMSSIKNSNKQILLKEGDNVTVEFVNSSEKGIFIVKNIEF